MNTGSCVRIGLLLLWSLMASFGETKETSPHHYRASLFDALDHHGSVYLCTITAHEVNAAGSDRYFERGKVTLSVSRTLLGPTRKTLVLPYACVTEQASKGRLAYTWLPIAEIDGQPLICVVNPGPGDSAEPTLDGIDESASQVKILANPTDPKIEEFDAICQLYQQLQTPNAASALKAALNDNRSDLRNFSRQAIVSKLGTTDADGAAALLKAQAQNWTDSADAKREAQVLAFYLEQRVGEVEPVVKTSRFSARCLAILATSPATTLREPAVDQLANCLQWLDRLSTLGLLSDLPAAEKTGLIQILTTEAPANPKASIILSRMTR